MKFTSLFLAALLLTAPGGAQTIGGEWQLTNSPISKLLDNNDNSLLVLV